MKSFVDRSALHGSSSGNAGTAEEFFGENLASFQVGGGLGGAYDSKPSPSKDVHHTVDERGFRAHHGKVDLFSLR
jgi:hypothetical protein